jgi:hypothetical protein
MNNVMSVPAITYGTETRSAKNRNISYMPEVFEVNIRNHIAGQNKKLINTETFTNGKYDRNYKIIAKKKTRTYATNVA